MFAVLLALVGSCLEPVATVVKELGVISLQVTRVPVAVRTRRLFSLLGQNKEFKKGITPVMQH